MHIESMESICFVGWIVSIVWKYLSKRSMCSLLVQLICLSLLLFFQVPKVIEAILFGNNYKGTLYYMIFILINIIVNGYHIEEKAKKFK